MSDLWSHSHEWDNGYAKGHKDGCQQGRADVLREHREQCQGKCFKCEVSVPFVNSDGEEVILPYSYSYKTDCEDNRYINAKEVLSLINRARADAINNFVINAITEFQNFDKEHGYPTLGDISVILSDVAEQLKEQNK